MTIISQNTIHLTPHNLDWLGSNYPRCYLGEFSQLSKVYPRSGGCVVSGSREQIRNLAALLGRESDFLAVR